jgi:hypothetical protein
MRTLTASRVVGIFALALATIVFLITATSSASNPAKGADTYGVGGGKGNFGGFIYTFKFDLSTHDGNTDFGHVSQTFTNFLGFTFSYTLDVDCVHVDPLTPTIASIGGKVTNVAPSNQPNDFGLQDGQLAMVSVEDGGNPSASAPVDSISRPLTGIDACDALLVPLPPPNVTQGNITVKLG